MISRELDEGRIYLLELNSRRTAGTHIHEFGRHAFGPDEATSILAACEFGCIIVAASTPDALELHQTLIERLHD